MEYFDNLEWIEEKFGDYICNTGGAIGSDLVFEEECVKKGIEVIAWSFPGHNTKSPNRKNLTKEELKEGFLHVQKANETLKRNIYNLSLYVKNLLSRNWFQVKNSDVIYAIASLDGNDKVSGGTGWCCMMGIDNNIPVYVFDSKFNSWFNFNYKNRIFEKYQGVPKLTKRFAGVGSREIDVNGIKATKELIEKMK
jgi:hypothetical protein